MSSIDDRLDRLPPLIRVHQHHKLLCEATGLSKPSLYRALNSGTLGVTPLRINSSMMIRRRDLFQALGVDQ